MAEQPSGPRSPSRFFSFRWAYLFLTAVLWSFFLPLIWTEPDLEAFWTPTFLLLNLLGEAGLGASWMRLHGVYGFSLHDWWYAVNPGDYLIEPMFGATAVCTVLLIGAILAFVVPESGRSKNLPAVRGVHTRGKLAAGLVLGMAMTALVAGVIDVSGLDLRPQFEELGWMSTSSVFNHPWYYGANTLTYLPAGGVARPISWVSTLLGVFMFGALAVALLTFVRPGRDRYWQAERWTLIFTLLGLVLTLFGMFGMRQESYYYSDLELYLGGCYTTFVIGFFTLTWAWTCRTGLFLMCMRYEKASRNADEPRCFACGYDLRMLVSDKCPECGTPVKPELMDKIRALQDGSDQAESRSTTR